MTRAVTSRAVHVLVAAALLLSLACTSAATRNRTNLQQLVLGMDKAAVLTVMGPPDTTEAVQASGGGTLEVLYYITENPRGPTDWSLELSTPIVLRNGSLIGWGTEVAERALKDQLNSR